MEAEKAVAGGLMSVRKIAVRFDVRRATIYNWRRKGVLPCHVEDHLICLVPEEFEQWLEAWLGRPKRRGPYTIREQKQKLIQATQHMQSDPDNLSQDVQE
jgi:hypothetical protein